MLELEGAHEPTPRGRSEGIGSKRCAGGELETGNCTALAERNISKLLGLAEWINCASHVHYRISCYNSRCRTHTEPLTSIITRRSMQIGTVVTVTKPDDSFTGLQGRVVKSPWILEEQHGIPVQFGREHESLFDQNSCEKSHRTKLFQKGELGIHPH